jgi:hypothetical protein
MRNATLNDCVKFWLSERQPRPLARRGIII